MRKVTTQHFNEACYVAFYKNTPVHFDVKQGSTRYSLPPEKPKNQPKLQIKNIQCVKEEKMMEETTERAIKKHMMLRREEIDYQPDI